MTFAVGLDDDQQLFADTTQRFIEAVLPLPATRDLHERSDGFDRGWWAQGAELGWFAMLVPEKLGGGDHDGNGLQSAALVAEQHGAHVQPGPFVATSVTAWAVAAHGAAPACDELLAGLVDGSVVAAWANADQHGGLGPALRGEEVDGGLRVTGRTGIVQDVGAADVVLVAVEVADRVVHVVLDTEATGVSVVPMAGLDLSRRYGALVCDGVVVPVERVLAEPTLADGLLARALVLNAAETVGAMDALFTMTVDYAKNRTAFGRPIGSFQSIKHILADQALYLETAKAGVDGALREVVRGTEQALELCHVVSAYLGDHGNELAQECLQVHGGIGFTWEHDLHLLMRRIRANSAQYGTPTWHRAEICRHHGLEAR